MLANKNDMDKNVKIVLSATDQTGAAISSAKKGVDSLEGSTTDAGRSFGFLGTMAKSAAVAIGAAAVAGVTYGFNVAAQLQTAEVGLKTLLGSAEEAAATVKRLKVEAARTPFELPGLTQATQLLSSVTKDGNKSIDILLNVGEALAAMGKGQAELDRIVINLQQIGSVGKASMVDIKQFAFAGIPIFDMLKEHFEKGTVSIVDNSKKIKENGAELKKLQSQLMIATQRQDEFTSKTSKATQMANSVKISELREKITALNGSMSTLNVTNGKAVTGFTSVEDAIADGKVTFELLTELFDKANDEGGQFFNAFVNQSGTFNQALSNMKDSIGIFFADFVVNTGLFQGLTNAMIFASSTLSNYKQVVQDAKDRISELLDMLDQKTGVVTAFKDTWQPLVAILRDQLIPLFVDIWARHGPLLTELGKSMAIIFGVALVGALHTLSGFLAAVAMGITTILAFGAKLIDALATTWIFWIDAFTAAWNFAARAIEKVVNLMQRAKDMASKVGGGISSAVSAIIPGRAAGGPVSGGSSYLVGEKGPEIFSPKVNGDIIPNRQLSGGRNIIINITGNTLLDSYAAQKIGDLIINRLKLSSNI